MYEFTDDLLELYKIINRCFNKQDLETICFCLNLDYDNFPGDSFIIKAQEIIKYHIRTRRVDTLWNVMVDMRPHQFKPVGNYTPPEPEVIVHEEPKPSPIEVVIAEMETAIAKMQEQVFELKLIHGIIRPK